MKFYNKVRSSEVGISSEGLYSLVKFKYGSSGKLPKAVLSRLGAKSCSVVSSCLKLSDVLEISSNAPIGRLKFGGRYKLKYLSEGLVIHSISRLGNSAPKYVRSSRCEGRIIKIKRNIVSVQLPSKKIIELSSESFCTIGKLARFKPKLTKAGDSRHRGIRPKVRGEAMNAVDHPHGGSSRGRKHPKTKWGKLAKFRPVYSRKLK